MPKWAANKKREKDENKSNKCFLLFSEIGENI
jgi:hypothetical protein